MLLRISYMCRLFALASNILIAFSLLGLLHTSDILPTAEVTATVDALKTCNKPHVCKSSNLNNEAQ